MNPIIFLVFLILGVCSRPLETKEKEGNKPNAENKDKDAVVIRSEFEQDIPNSYRFQFETSNGIAQGEVGEFEETGRFEGLLVRKGFFTYRDVNNVQRVVTYVADDKGYRPRIHQVSSKHDQPVQEILKNASVENSDGNDTLLEKHALNPDFDDDRIGTALLISLGGGSVG